MPAITVKGVQVDFPFDPYPCQIIYMEKVIECLQTSVNGVLESPTGTGKTLCLLCSSLAWLNGKKAAVAFKKQTGISDVLQDRENLQDDMLQRIASKLQESSGNTWGTSEFVVPKIIYASRTHSQLSQAVQELKRTTYNSVKACVLGSREQFCINDQVKKEPNNNAKVHMCRAKVKARRCFYYNTLEDQKRSGDPRSGVGNVVDIEDLVKYGEKTKVCPYYLARELKNDADIIFMPYNYLLDPKSRRAHGVELQGNILILDEAHNLEKICEESSSFDLTSVDLATAIEETTRLMEKIIDLSEMENQATDFGDSAAVEPDFTLEDLIKLKAVLKDFEDTLDAVVIPKHGPGLTKSGMFIFEMLSKVGITFESKNYLLDLLQKLVSYLTQDGAGSVLHSKGAGLGKFTDVLRIVFSQEPGVGGSLIDHQERLTKFYKVHMHFKEEIVKRKKIDSWATSGDSEKRERVLSYWCFSPGHSMRDLEAHGIKSIILTSGTLSPLQSFTMEMQIPFPVTLENPHVIEKYQVSISILGKGPDGTVLNSSYQTRSDPAYQASLGNAIVNFARVVPNGLLIFFPSYPVMDKCVEFWKEKNIWNRITQYKPIMVEPKGKTDFNNAMDEFYEKVQDSTLNGAIFMAVCRGKVSEGLDFSDNNGRAVVITGLPFPPRMDPKILLKMQFLDEMRTKSLVKGIGGSEWYRQQASRAVNQAIGRVIRHKEDFGAIILCDTRFNASDIVAQLPVWIRPYIKKQENFGHAIRDVMQFFKNVEKLLPVTVTKSRRHSEQKSHGAHFLPTLSRTTQKQSNARAICYEQSSTVTCHGPSLKQELCKLSEKKLSDVYNQCDVQKTQRKGLIQALEYVEKNTDQDLLSETQIPSHQPIKTKQQKKRRIVIKKANEKFVSSSMMVEKKPISRVHVNTAEDYIKEVKKILLGESYKVFSKALIEYRKMESLEKVSSVLADLFMEDPSNHHLFRLFYKFVRPHHKKQFDQICQDLTGLSCGYTPEHSATKRLLHSGIEEPAEKRSKMDCGGDDVIPSLSCLKLTSASSIDKQKIQKFPASLSSILSSVTLNGLQESNGSSVAKPSTNKHTASSTVTLNGLQESNGFSFVKATTKQHSTSSTVTSNVLDENNDSSNVPSTSGIFTRLKDDCGVKPGSLSNGFSAVCDRMRSGDGETHSNDRTRSRDDEKHSSDRTRSRDYETHSSDRTWSRDSETHSSDRTWSGDCETHSSDRTWSGDGETHSSDRSRSGDSETHSSDQTRSRDNETHSNDRTRSHDNETRSTDRPRSRDNETHSNDRPRSGDNERHSGDRPRSRDNETRSNERPRSGDDERHEGERTRLTLLSCATASIEEADRCEKAIQMSQTTARFTKSGYTCERCGSDAHIPFQASCKHVCCYLCWKAVIKSNKLCPGCGAPVKRRDLKQLLFSSGPNVE